MSPSVRSVQGWTKDARRYEKEQQQAQAFDLWLDCKTQQEIAEQVGVDQKTISNWLGESAELRSFLDPPDSRQHFDVWSFGAAGDDAGDPAERDENTCRKPMAPSELVALGRAIEEQERPKAEERMREGGDLGREIQHGKLACRTGTTGHRGTKVDEIVGSGLGISGSNYGRAKRLHVVALNLTRRHLTDAQKVIVGRQIEPDAIEAARLRQAHGQTAPGKTLMDNSPEASSRPSRDDVASRVGLGSGRTYERGRKVLERTGKSRTELHYRAEFATKFQTETELLTAVGLYDSWTSLRADLKKQQDVEDNIVVATPAPEGLFGTIVADPPSGPTSPECELQPTRTRQARVRLATGRCDGEAPGTGAQVRRVNGPMAALAARTAAMPSQSERRGLGLTPRSQVDGQVFALAFAFTGPGTTST